VYTNLPAVIMSTLYNWQTPQCNFFIFESQFRQ